MKIKEKIVREIMATVKVKCPYCENGDIVLYEKNSTGRQRYLSLSIKTMPADLVQKKK